MTSREFVLALETLGWSQAEASRQLGVTESAVSRWVHGLRGISGPVRIILEGEKRRAIQAWVRNEDPGCDADYITSDGQPTDPE